MLDDAMRRPLGPHRLGPDGQSGGQHYKPDSSDNPEYGQALVDLGFHEREQHNRAAGCDLICSQKYNL